MPVNKRSWIGLIIGAFIFISSCTSTPKSAVVIPNNIQEITNPLAENLVTALDKQDYEAFQKDMDDVMQKAMTEQAFTEIRRLFWGQYGNYQSLAFAKALDQKGYLGVFYSLTFEKGKVTMNIVLTPNAPYKISGLWFPTE